jgi:hypothetical protein
MTPIPVDVRQNGKPWPGYFLVRTTGEVVPLIAVDELPLGIEIVGVPRSLDLEETIGMLNLGLSRSTGSFYHLVQEQDMKGQGSEAGGKAKLVFQDINEETGLIFPLSKSAGIPSQHSPPPRSPQGSANANSFSPPTTTIGASRPLANSNSSPATTQLCRHWCSHGICKWGQQCRYRHIMPMTLHGLQEVGLPDWPMWFRKENPGYFVSDARGGGISGRVGRARRIIGDSAGLLSACCGSLHAVNGVCGGKGGSLRGNGKVAVRERSSGKVLKGEELGEQIIARLRDMSKEGRVVGEKTMTGRGAGNGIIERAAARDTKNWEDESEDGAGNDETDGEEKDKPMVHGKLVDV